MFKALFYAVLFGSTGLASCVHATLIAWKDNIPSSLKPFQNNAQQLAALAQDRILIYSHPQNTTFVPTLKKNPNPLVSFTSSATVVPIAADKVSQLLSHYEQYARLFPALKSAKLIEKQDNITQMKYKVSIPTPIPVLNFKEDITFQHQLNNNSIASIVVSAPIPYGVGKLEWFDVGNNKTLVTLTQWGDLNQPQGFLITKILNAMPEVKLGIPVGTNTFILESIRKKLSATKITALNPGQFPSDQLSTQQLSKIAQLSQASQQPVSLIHLPSSVPYVHGRENLRFSSTYQYYAAPPQQLQKWTQASAYQSLFPHQIKKTTTSSLINNNQNAEFKVSVGLGVITIPFNFKLNFNYPNATANSFYANGGDLKYLKGQMTFNPFQQGTLLKMTTAAKIDDSAPFLLRAARSLPYHEILPAVSGNTIFALKIRNAM